MSAGWPTCTVRGCRGRQPCGRRPTGSTKRLTELGTGERSPGDVSVRQGLGAGPVQRAHDRATGACRSSPCHARGRQAPPAPSRPKWSASTFEPDADFEKYRGKLAGKIVLTQSPREVRMLEGIVVQRWNDALLKEADDDADPGGDTRRLRPAAAAPAWPIGFSSSSSTSALSPPSTAAATRRLSPETTRCRGARSAPDGGTIFPSGGGGRDAASPKMVPSVTLAVEHYNRMIRVLDKGLPVKVELDIRTEFYDDAGANGFNIVARPSWHRSQRASTCCWVRISTAWAPAPARPTTRSACR